MANKMNSSAILASLSPQEILVFQIRNGIFALYDITEQIEGTEKKNLRFLGGLWWMIRGSNATLSNSPNRSKR